MCRRQDVPARRRRGVRAKARSARAAGLAPTPHRTTSERLRGGLGRRHIEIQAERPHAPQQHGRAEPGGHAQFVRDRRRKRGGFPQRAVGLVECAGLRQARGHPVGLIGRRVRRELDQRPPVALGRAAAYEAQHLVIGIKVIGKPPPPSVRDKASLKTRAAQRVETLDRRREAPLRLISRYEHEIVQRLAQRALLEADCPQRPEISSDRRGAGEQRGACPRADAVLEAEARPAGQRRRRHPASTAVCASASHPARLSSRWHHRRGRHKYSESSRRSARSWRRQAPALLVAPVGAPVGAPKTRQKSARIAHELPSDECRS